MTKGAGEDKAAFTKRSRDQYQARLKDEGFVIKYDESEGNNIPVNGDGLKDHYSAELKALVAALLVRDPTKRLGYKNDSDEILEHPAFKLLTAVEGQDGSPDDNGPEFKFIKPDLYNFDQDFDKKKKEKDEAVAGKEDDNIEEDQQKEFDDFVEKDTDTAVAT